MSQGFQTFGMRLAYLRKVKKVSQRQLSEKSGIPIGTLRYHERSRREMTAADLYKYARALEVSTEKFRSCVSIKAREQRMEMLVRKLAEARRTKAKKP